MEWAKCAINCLQPSEVIFINSFKAFLGKSFKKTGSTGKGQIACDTMGWELIHHPHHPHHRITPMRI
jgi:hypothetical protein